jgi:tRNA U34 5-methylaminomethyl-2-thiouridine-forming methyltransferase MnmC
MVAGSVLAPCDGILRGSFQPFCSCSPRPASQNRAVQKRHGYKLVRVAGGAHSLYSDDYQETFHPVVGPVAEAEALYVRQIRLFELLNHHAGDFIVWDVGLGAAANAIAVLSAAGQVPCSIRMLSFDQTTDPLDFALSHTEELSYLKGWEPVLRRLIAEGKVDDKQGPCHFEWVLHVADFPTLLTRPETALFPKPHAILFDAFSPARNPAMWTLDLFRNLFRILDPVRPCTLPTYSRSTMMRATLLLAGFFVGVGHATGEKEETTIASNSLQLIEEPLDRSWLRRARRSTSAEPLAEPVYRQARLSTDSFERLQQHPQFR